jgi:hypothetical protein
MSQTGRKKDRFPLQIFELFFPTILFVPEESFHLMGETDHFYNKDQCGRLIVII